MAIVYRRNEFCCVCVASIGVILHVHIVYVLGRVIIQCSLSFQLKFFFIVNYSFSIFSEFLTVPLPPFIFRRPPHLSFFTSRVFVFLTRSPILGINKTRERVYNSNNAWFCRNSVDKISRYLSQSVIQSLSRIVSRSWAAQHVCTHCVWYKWYCDLLLLRIILVTNRHIHLQKKNRPLILSRQ